MKLRTGAYPHSLDRVRFYVPLTHGNFLAQCWVAASLREARMAARPPAPNNPAMIIIHPTIWAPVTGSEPLRSIETGGIRATLAQPFDVEVPIVDAVDSFDSHTVVVVTLLDGTVVDGMVEDVAVVEVTCVLDVVVVDGSVVLVVVDG